MYNVGIKNAIFVVVLVSSLLFLAGCSQQNPTSSSQLPNSQTMTCQGSAQNFCDGNVRNYDPECKSGNWIFKSEYCENGCEGGACKTQSCPVSCDDGNPCTTDYCNSATASTCQHTPLNGPQPGCVGSAMTCQTNTCEGGTCASKPLSPCCGNTICETGETSQTCSSDCKPKLDVQIIGCTQGFDIAHQMGAVTNVFFTVQNIGQGDTSGVRAEVSSSAEDRAHPNKRGLIGDIPYGYQSTQKLTVDTRTNNFGQITVTVGDSNGNLVQKGTNDCSTIDEGTIKNIGTMIKIAGMF